MDANMQELIALGIVVLVVAAELLRRYRKRKNQSSGCDGCEKGADQTTAKETPLKFYKRT